MNTWLRDNNRIWVPLLLWFVACAMYYFLVFAKAYVELEVETPERSWFKVFWAAEDQGFSERRVAKARIIPGRNHYKFYLTDLADIAQLRIDSHEFIGSVKIVNFRIHQSGFADITLSSPENLSRLQAYNNIESYLAKENSFTVVSNGIDPGFILELSGERRAIAWGMELARLAAIGCLVLMLYRGGSTLIRNYQFVPLALVVVLVLVFTMAGISKDNVHPDEMVHVAAVEYYTDHWLPPEVDDESIRDSYSPYGTSRLNKNEIYYLFAGKFAHIIQPLQFGNYVTSRMFNVFLLLSILLYVIRVADARLVALPLLISPQIWYLFSYCNSDALAVTTAFFAGCQLVIPGSMFNRYLSKSTGLTWLLQAVVLGIGFGVLNLLKDNYLTFLCYFLFMIAIGWYRLHDREMRRSWLMRLAVICAVAAVLVIGKRVADYQVNGPDRAEKIAETRIDTAHPIYNPTTELEMQHRGLYMKDRGVTLKDMVVNYRWFEQSFRSAFGVYGYFTISGTYAYYDVVRWSAIALMLFFFGSVFLRGGAWNSLSAVTMVAISVALIGASFLHSWTSDFQTQGRYLFPIVGMLGILCAQNRDHLSSRWLSLLTLWMFCISIYSFSMIALLNVPRRLLL